MSTNNHYGLTEKELTQAQAYMVAEGYMDGTEDIIHYTRVMVEDHPFMVKRKIQQWSNSYEQSSNK